MSLAASSYPLLNLFWTMFIFFLWVIWIWILITVFIDIFRSPDLSGWAKALWFLSCCSSRSSACWPTSSPAAARCTSGRGGLSRRTRSSAATSAKPQRVPSEGSQADRA